jgi:hypothetical protein
MPIRYEILKNTNIIFAVGHGVVTAQDVLDHLGKLAEDNGYKAPMKKLVDYRSIESIRISAPEAEIIAKKKKELAATFAKEKCAFVAPGDLAYGTSRVHQVLIESANIDTEVFRSIGEALEWLNITVDSG